MPTPSEDKTVQARILAYAEAIGWTFVSRDEAEKRRGGIPAPLGGSGRGWKTPAPLSLVFDDLLDARVREFNSRYAEAERTFLGQFRHLHTNIYGNREFLEDLRNRGTFFDHESKGPQHRIRARIHASTPIEVNVHHFNLAKFESRPKAVNHV